MSQDIELNEKDVPQQEEQEVTIPDEPEIEGSDVKEDAEQPFDEHAEERPSEPVKEKRPRANKRINELQREKYQALMELENIKSENEKLRKIAELSNQSALFNYEENLKQRLDYAKGKMAQAIESGDIQEQTNAQIELSMAASEYKQAKDWKIQKEYENNQHQESLMNEQKNRTGIPSEAQNWARRNTWMNSNSEDYDEELTNHVDAAIDRLDAYLYRNGFGNQIYSREYFQEIDNYVNSLRQQREQTYERDEDDYNPNQGRHIPMKQARQSVSPVRSQNAESGRRSEKFTVSKDELELASMSGITPEKYVIEREKLRKAGKLYTGRR
jgi:hypothetical protein